MQTLVDHLHQALYSQLRSIAALLNKIAFLQPLRVKLLSSSQPTNRPSITIDIQQLSPSFLFVETEAGTFKPPVLRAAMASTKDWIGSQIN